MGAAGRPVGRWRIGCPDGRLVLSSGSGADGENVSGVSDCITRGDGHGVLVLFAGFDYFRHRSFPSFKAAIC